MSQAPNFELFAQFMRQMSIASHLFNNRMNKKLDEKDFTVAQFYILNYLAAQPAGKGQKISDIVAAVEVLQPAVTKIINKFDVQNLVKIVNSTTDRRVKFITINEAGHKKLIELRNLFTTDILTWNQEWQETDMQDFINKLTKFGSWLEDNRL